MASTGTTITFFSGGTVAAGTVLVSSWADLSGNYGASIGAKIKNGATGPTLPAMIQLEVANDYNGGAPSNPIKFGGELTGNTTNSGTYSWGNDIPMAWQAARVLVGSNTGQTIITDVDLSSVTAVA